MAENNKTIGICCGLIIIIAVIAILFTSDTNELEKNKTIEMYGVNITVPADANAEITHTNYNTKNSGDGVTYEFDDENKNLTIYVTDDFCDEANFTMSYDPKLGYYQKTRINNKTVLVYSENQDLTEQILLSAH